MNWSRPVIPPERVKADTQRIKQEVERVTIKPVGPLIFYVPSKEVAKGHYFKIRDRFPVGGRKPPSFCSLCGCRQLMKTKVHLDNCPHLTGRKWFLWWWKWRNRQLIRINRSMEN